MPRMNKSNARQLLSSTFKKFHQVTGESFGVAFTWKGNLSVLGTGSFQDYINQNKDEVWRKLSFTSQKEQSKPAHDLEFISMLEGDITSYNVPTLRRMISWLVQKSLGTY